MHILSRNRPQIRPCIRGGKLLPQSASSPTIYCKQIGMAAVGTLKGNKPWFCIYETHLMIIHHQQPLLLGKSSKYVLDQQAEVNDMCFVSQLMYSCFHSYLKVIHVQWDGFVLGHGIAAKLRYGQILNAWERIAGDIFGMNTRGISTVFSKAFLYLHNVLFFCSPIPYYLLPFLECMAAKKGSKIAELDDVYTILRWLFRYTTCGGILLRFSFY